MENGGNVGKKYFDEQNIIFDGIFSFFFQGLN